MKKQLKATWNQILNKRRQAYWNAIKNENLADTYEKWIKKEEVIFPRKFRIKSIDSETSEETQIRLNLASQRYEAEITLLRLRVSKFKKQFEECDKTIAEEIQQLGSGLIEEKLQELWIKDVSREEEKSQTILESKKLWLE